ncbi:MAG: hypothetical protein HY268_27775 [Deltaproteobacteria bacterium]|nr:hypothetical protein [Deltaproteobacteria bacterium]
MSLSAHVAALQALVAATPFVTATALAYEERPPSAGLIKGNILFADGSQLDFKEFLITRPTLRVIKYGYHYRSDTRLIFRYDNASDPAARTLPTFPSHKHVPSGLLAAESPSLEQVLQEIVSQLKVP